MRPAPEILLAGLLFGLAFVQAGCQSEFHPWVEPEELKVKILSDAEFVRTRQGDYVDGYLAESGTDFETKRMFMVLELPRYVNGDRLTVRGRFTDDSVRMPSGEQGQEQVRVFQVEEARPFVPKAPDVPPRK